MSGECRRHRQIQRTDPDRDAQPAPGPRPASRPPGAGRRVAPSRSPAGPRPCRTGFAGCRGRSSLQRRPSETPAASAPSRTTPRTLTAMPEDDGEGEQAAEAARERRRGVRAGLPGPPRAADRRQPGEEQEDEAADHQRDREVLERAGDAEGGLGHRAASGLWRSVRPPSPSAPCRRCRSRRRSRWRRCGRRRRSPGRWRCSCRRAGSGFRWTPSRGPSPLGWKASPSSTRDRPWRRRRAPRRSCPRPARRSGRSPPAARCLTTAPRSGTVPSSWAWASALRRGEQRQRERRDRDRPREPRRTYQASFAGFASSRSLRPRRPRRRRMKSTAAPPPSTIRMPDDDERQLRGVGAADPVERAVDRAFLAVDPQRDFVVVDLGFLARVLDLRRHGFGAVVHPVVVPEEGAGVVDRLPFRRRLRVGDRRHFGWSESGCR